MLFRLITALAVATLLCAPAATRAQSSVAETERQFRELPMDARRHVGPLFWLHGEESPEKLRSYLDIVAEGGNGSFTAESRPHKDWLGEGWFRDLGVCLDQAKKNDLYMWIFDEKWWPSGEVGGTVPEKYGSRYLRGEAVDVKGPKSFEREVSTNTLVAVLAGEASGDAVKGESLKDLTDQVSGGKLTWDAPEGDWKVMVFTWERGKNYSKRYQVDGLDPEATRWFLDTVYQPHYDHFGDDFGKTIRGYFFDEPATPGDWGPALMDEFKRRNVDWKQAFAAHLFQLVDPEQQTAYDYEYRHAVGEAWGRTFYGGITDWCEAHNVESIGHFLEHRREYLLEHVCAGDVFQLMKYNSMGGIDAVFKQFVMGKRNEVRDSPCWETPKMASSASHVYGKKDDRAMIEIFGARGQDLTYKEMKWWTDRMAVCGINFFITHSFNPKSPYDTDCPPYFYDSGCEPRWPLYRVYADYAARLSNMLSGGRHVCPVAFLYMGQSYHVGENIPPEDMSTAMQDALYDCDWMPYDAFGEAKLADGKIALHDEEYPVLVMPAVEAIPFETLDKARKFYEEGGVVVAYGMLPSKSVSPDHGSADIAELTKALWGEKPEQSLEVLKVNDAGGRSYFLSNRPTPREFRQVMNDAGVAPTLDVLVGETNNWVHVLHRVKDGRDVFFIANQNSADEPARNLRFLARAQGVPEVWDPVRNETYHPRYQQTDEGVEFDLTLEPVESALVVFADEKRELNPPFSVFDRDEFASPTLVRLPEPESEPTTLSLMMKKKGPDLRSASWIWYPEEGAPSEVPEGVKRYFRGAIEIPEDAKIQSARFRLTVDNDFELYINGKKTGEGTGGMDDWRRPVLLDIAEDLKPGRNVVAIEAENFKSNGPNPAGVIGRYEIELANGETIEGSPNDSWKAARNNAENWMKPDFDDSGWEQAKEVAPYGKVWGRFEDEMRGVTLSPVEGEVYRAKFVLPQGRSYEGYRAWLAMDGMEQPVAAVRVNDRYAGGVLGAPLRLDITDYVQPGDNIVRIEPYAPESVRLYFAPVR